MDKRRMLEVYQTKNNKKTACFSRGDGKISTASDAKTSASYLRTFPLFARTHPSHNHPPPPCPPPLYLLHGYLRQTEQGSEEERGVSCLDLLAGSSSSSPGRKTTREGGGHEVLKKEEEEAAVAANWKFQNGAYCLYFFSTHACPLPAPPTSLPRLSLYISITPAIMTLRRERKERERGSTLVRSSFNLERSY